MSRDYEHDDKLIIDKKILSIPISMQDLDDILDKHIDKEEVTEEEERKIVTYILQLFYRSGRKESSSEEIYNKYNALIGDRVIQHMEGMGVIESLFDSERGEMVYKLSPKGEELAKQGEENEDDI